MELPGLDGENLAAAIYQQAGAPVAVLLISAWPEQTISAAADRAGAVGYLTKPFQIDDVSNAVRRALSAL